MTDSLLLLNYLSDGNFHSGEDLAAKFNVSRTAIWKQIKKLNTILPFDINSVPSKGYQIEQPIQFLNKRKFIDCLLERLPGETVDDLADSSKLVNTFDITIENIEMLLECPSTNQYLLDRIALNKLSNFIVLSEMQTAGRGRRGREWVSPFAANIYLSLLWSLGISMGETSGLSLVVAISVAKVLQSYGVDNVKLKWPNDIYVGTKKISGVLLEIRGESNSPCQAIVGIGVNVNMPSNAAESIDQQWTDINSVVGLEIDRNKFSAAILKELIPRFKKFSLEGFPVFIDEWNELDFLIGKPVSIDGHMKIKNGIARGVEQNGALRIESENKVELLFSGEVSVRAK